MWGFQRLAGAAVWSVLIVITWLHTQFIAAPVQWWLDNVMGLWEESAKVALREVFRFFGRLINGIATWIVAVFVDKNFQSRGDGGARRSEAWKAFWARNKRTPNTLNALAEREGFFTDRRSPPPTPRPTVHQPSGTWSYWPFWKRSKPVPRTQTAATTGRGMKRSGSDLFSRPSGLAVAERLERRGLLESTKVSLEIAIETVFDAFRSAVSSALMLRAQPRDALPPAAHTHGDVHTSSSSHSSSRRGATPGAASSDAALQGRATANRTFGSWEDISSGWTSSDVILQSGYPLEEHVVTTSDGYILTMQRIPRKDSREVVFFQHGVLDTSLGWVSNGVQGSQAFAAFDRGADVWLGNSRANPPRAHAEPARSGAAYWAYSFNELGMEDIAALIDRIHSVKVAELAAGLGRMGGLMSGGIVGGKGGEGSSHVGVGASRPVMHKRSGSDSALAALHHITVATNGIDTEGPAAHPPNEEQIRALNLAAASDPDRRSLDSSSSPPPRRSSSTNKAFSTFSKRFSSDNTDKKRNQKQQQTGSPAVLLEGEKGEAQLQREPLRRRNSLFRIFTKDSPFSSSQTQPDTPPTAAQRLEQSGAHDRLRSFAVGEEDGLVDDSTSSWGGFGSTRGEEEEIQEEPEEEGDDKTAHLPSPPHSLPPLPPLHYLRERSASFTRAATPDIDRGTPSLGASLGASPRTSQLGMSPSPSPSPFPSARMMTPDRVSVGGREQPPVEWSEAAANAPWDPFLDPGEGLHNSSGTPRHSHADAGADNSAGDLAFSEASAAAQPYTLQAVGHSLGGASLLIYAVMCRVLGRPHHLSRLVLLTPAGFHRKYPNVAAPFLYILPLVMRLLNWIRPGVGTPVYIPSSLLRYITFKLSVDLQHIPALNELTRAALRLLLNGDASEWDRALQMPHYAVASMPALSLHTGSHFIQLINSGNFQLYDYGSPSANRKRYGTDRPPDVAAHYHLLERDLAVDLVAGKSDGVIARDDVAAHYEAMRSAGLAVSYKELDVGHLDMTFAVKDEVVYYVMSRLRLGGLGG